MIASRVSTSFLLLNLILSATTLAWSVELSSISGTVVNADQQPIPNAQVFLEQDLLSPLSRVTTDASGQFTFSNILPGTVGIVAYTPGLAFNGFTTTLGTGDIRSNNTIVLAQAGEVKGRVIARKKKGVSKAQITKVLLRKSKVVIPFSKLSSFGFQPPMTNEKGEFTVRHVPVGEVLALKVRHAEHAQGTADKIAVGEEKAEVVLSPGVLISGTIQSAEKRGIVPNTHIIFRNVNPPRNTVITKSGADGVYYLRLKPGDYIYESIGASYTSVSKPRIVVTGEMATETINLFVAPIVTINGKVMDAQTGEGISGARVRLETGGKINSFAVTGQGGDYSFSAPAGTATVRLWETPGYIPPKKTAYKIPVKVGEIPPLPTYFLLPLPTYSLAVVDAQQQQPVSQAVVQVLDPPQIGWRTTNEKGMTEISLSSMPKSGNVIGFVEHPSLPEGAAFTIPAKNAQDAIIQLLPQRPIKGRVVNAQGKGLSGWTVSCQIAQENSNDSITLWNVLSDSDGNFQHPSGLENIPLIYSATLKDEDGLQTSTPNMYTLHKNASSTIPDIMANANSSADSFVGDKFPWKELSGNSVAALSQANTLRVVIFAPGQQATIVQESLEQQQAILQKMNIQIALVISDDHRLSSESIAVCTGESPGHANVYVVSKDNRVLSESLDMPTVSLLRSLSN